jgi:hypothetical protein
VTAQAEFLPSPTRPSPSPTTARGYRLQRGAERAYVGGHVCITGTRADVEQSREFAPEKSMHWPAAPIPARGQPS